MGFFSDDKPKVSPLEFTKKVRPALSSEGLSHEKLDRLQAIFEDKLKDTAASQRGIHQSDLDATMNYLRGHKDSHLFSPHEIDKIETELKKHL